MAKGIYIVGILPEQQGELKEEKVKKNPMITAQVSIMSQWYILKFILGRYALFRLRHLFHFNLKGRKRPDQQEKQSCHTTMPAEVHQERPSGRILAVAAAVTLQPVLSWSQPRAAS